MPEKIQNIDLSGKTILVVEDTKVSQTFYNSILRKFKATLLLASDGQIAVDLFKENPNIDLILLDLSMPNKNGFEAGKEILEIDPEAKIIVHSSSVSDEIRQQCIDLGFIDFIPKPINLKELISKIEMYIGL